MKTAFAIWRNRIAPVFDVSRQIHIIDEEPGQAPRQTLAVFDHDEPVHRALRLAELGIRVLVCGAISRPLQELIAAYGIRVVPFVAGDLDTIIEAWRSGGFNYKTFAMPGCVGRRGHRTGRRTELQGEENTMNTKGRGTMGPGAGQRQGRGGRRSGGSRSGGMGRGASGRQGGMGRGTAAAQTGSCVCPQCGHKQAHKRGAPCIEQTCSECGAIMTRG